MKNLIRVLGLGTSVLGFSFNIGCQSSGFEPITVEEREIELQTASVFGSKVESAEAFIAAAQVVEGQGTKSRAPSSLTGTNGTSVNEDDDVDRTPPLVIPSTYTCSNSRTNTAGTNLLSTSGLTLIVGNCQDSAPEVRNTLIASKLLKSKNCNRELRSALYDSSGKAKAKPDAIRLVNDRNYDLIMSIAGVGQAFKIEVLYDINQASNGSASQLNCDRRASPLFILTEKSIVSFSSPLSGIEFDILGDRSRNQKRLISWTNSAALSFISLPNERGEVEGVNQLFGDNTRGPDGQYAADGFAALAKFDSNQDGFISSDDQIFSKLKLWNDANFDGKGEGNELVGLLESGIEVIDLRFDKKYLEEDQWGNQIKFKSVAKTRGGELRLVFDIWFRHLPLFARLTK